MVDEKGGAMLLGLVMALAKTLKVKPEEFAKNWVEEIKDVKYGEKFGVASGATKKK